ncbi:hypothetical protein [Clostridium cylindrosporum]|uniref:Outer membrane lipoprotein-sorting protein n=1 Tax=Clostridium cylindrosporum DSM 605 TaxID=1121307 RepID=A0A0J8D9X6_CLOCY|nr:hypothetical protein [Clostridium cylindrosporum]KMT21114.1 hypothetical protein CLCY_1c03480 [Clostridium cylindrosporum DSM 605]
MKALKIISSMAMVLFLVACGDKGECYNSHKKLMEMKSYTADATITVHGNKSSSIYKVKQTVEDPNNVKIETIEPKELKGKTVVYSENKWKVYHPLIKEVVEFDALRDIDEIIYMGIIQKKFIMSEDIKEKLTEKDGERCIEFKAKLPNSNEHRNYAKLYITEKDATPTILEIYNEDNKVTVEVKYTNFKYNPSIDKGAFKLEKLSSNR